MHVWTTPPTSSTLPVRPRLRCMIGKSAEERRANAADPQLRNNLLGLASVVWYVENRVGEGRRQG